MMVPLLLVVGALCGTGTVAQYPSHDWRPYRQLFYNSQYQSSVDRSYYNNYLGRGQDYSDYHNPGRPSYDPQPKPVYGSPNHNDFFYPEERPIRNKDQSDFQSYNRPLRPVYGPPDRESFQPTRHGGPYGNFQPSRQGGSSGDFQPSRQGGSSGNFQPSRQGGSGNFQPSRQDGSSGNFQPPRQGDSFRGSQQFNPMEVIFSWKQVDFDFYNENIREEMIRSQRFIPRNNLILDMDVFGEGPSQIVFVTIPRVRPGVPASLATVSRRRRNGANLLVPFPDWQSHTPGDCENGITSVLRTHIDLCGRLWVLDSGNNDAFVTGQSRIVCRPQILIYDLNNYDRLIGKYRFPDSTIANNSLMVTINVDSRNNDCSDSVAYIADAFGDKLIVFNLRTQQFWRTNSTLFYPYPDQTMFSVNGVSFMLSGGIFGLALSPLFQDKRRLYFHCIDSIKQSYVDTADILDPRPWLQSIDARPRVFKELNGNRSSQSAAAAMTDEGVMFFGLIGSNEMACWNSQTDFGIDNTVILAKDDRNLQFNSGVKVYRGKLYAVTSRLQNYVTNQVREDEENYRILVGDIRQMTRGTKCDVRQFTGYHSDSNGYEFNNYNSARPNYYSWK